MKNPILKNKIYLYLTEFIAGMSVMAVELGASRLLAPYFSSSQIVWTIIIGTIMIAMALGNLFGGKWADKDPDPDRLYRRILIAACYIACIPVLGKYIIIAISGLVVFTVNSNYLIIAAFAACMIVFVFPLFLLGTVTPSLVKYTVDSLDEGGSVVGRLNAANTIGSILGTFLPTFVTIPAVGTGITFLLFSGILLIIVILYFARGGSKKDRLSLLAAIIIYALCCIFGHSSSFAFWEDDLTYEGESVYNYLQVREDNTKTILSTNVLFGVQSVYRKEKSLTGMYYDYAMAAPVMTGVIDPSDEDGTSILVLGMGTGTFATQCDRYFTDVNIKGVEIDDRITGLARRYFAMPDDMEVVTYDGRAYLAADKQQYDVIMVDAYQDITIPFQMSSREFFELVSGHLKDDGVMVVNMNMRGQREGNINQYLADTIATVFPSVYTSDVPGTTNRELLACKNGDVKTRLKENLVSGSCDEEDLMAMMQKVLTGLQRYDKGEYLLTDDKAPVELLGMKVIDDIIRDEIMLYRDVYETEGFKGLLEQL